ncbi:hypothetical protein BC628DRAFT_1417789 [Trametes gibbosa]|nr:hypothetical protein BC628DRAFT_1417789 [Trametes gibbosa]
MLCLLVSCRKNIPTSTLTSAFIPALPTAPINLDSSAISLPGPRICDRCSAVLRSYQFKQALRVPTPSSEHYKYLNKKYRNETVSRLYLKVVGLQDLVEEESSTLSVFARFALGIHQGKYAARAYLVDLIKALIEVSDCEVQGVGKQNFTYGPALVEFATTCAIVSPEVYRVLSAQFQLPALRTMQCYRAKSPRFPTVINDQTFDLVAQYMDNLGYSSGPVALSCDDTKLHPSYRTYYDHDRKIHLLIGGTDEPRAVANADELCDVLRNPTLGPKATKIHLWCLLPAVPGLPPLIIAAKPIPNNLTAAELYIYLRTILTGLFRCHIRVASYLCDGTETERAVQKLLLFGPDGSSEQKTYAIPHPQHDELGLPHLSISMAVVDGYVLAIIQDSKHPTVIRDVEKLDRQDDNAATRLFSSAALQHLISIPGDHLIGTTVYLFVFGELVDAYQNRHILHSERIKMVLRARFFLDIWRRFLAAAGYPENCYCISREAIAIIHILIDGLIALIVIHWDFMGDEKHPLFPWLHSTEVCEHVFGECCKLVKDFTYLDFIYMIPRLSTLVHAACKAARSSDPRAWASGYAHTYFESKDVNVAALALFPADDEIAKVGDLFRSDTISTRLPSLSSWFAPGQDPVWDADSSDSEADSLSLSDDEDDTPYEEEDRTEAAELQNLMDAEETAFGRSNMTNNKMFSLQCAAVAVTLDDITRLQSFEERTEDDRLADAEEEAQHSKHTLNTEPIHPFDRSLTNAANMDLNPLALIQCAHETDRAKKGTRTKGTRGTSSASSGNTSETREIPPPEEATSIRRTIISDIYRVLREESNKRRALGTGADRQLRWAGTSPTTTSGNMANAALVAGQRANAIVARRKKTFENHKVPRYEDVGNAHITQPNARQPGQFLLWLDPHSAQLSSDSRTLELNHSSAGLFHELEKAPTNISASIKVLSSTRKKKDEKSDEDVADEDAA